MFDEKLFPLNEVPKHIPERNGKPRALASVYRWANVGLSGYRLEVLLVGGAMYTSTEALQRFFRAVTLVKRGEAPALSDKAADEAQARTRNELKRFGIGL